MKSLYEILRSAKLGAGAAPDFHTALMAQKMPFAKGSGAEHEYTGAVPVTFTANGQPLLDYLISGNTVQSGAPSPDNPVMPQGTGERTNNLFDKNTMYMDDCFFSQGVYSSALPTYERAIIYFPIVGGQTYTIKIPNGAPMSVNSVCSINKPRYGTSYYINGETTFESYGFVTEFTRTTPESANWMAVQIGNLSVLSQNIRVNEGSTALPYEPYGIKIPISSANTTTPVYLGEVQTTRKIKKLVLTGNETVAGSAVTGGWIVTQLSDSINNTAGVQTAYCSHYLSKNNGAMSSLSQGEMCISTQVNNRINFVTTFATAEDFKAYLAQQYAAGTPVTVWYVLATEETGIVNEPLMKIGDYADTLSMEQAGAQIPTTRGTNTLDVLADVKPSEVYIKYKE